jgi:hypothetical protein
MAGEIIWVLTQALGVKGWALVMITFVVSATLCMVVVLSCARWVQRHRRLLYEETLRCRLVQEQLGEVTVGGWLERRSCRSRRGVRRR